MGEAVGGGVTGVILAGGRGARFGDPFKCLRPVCGVPMMLRVAAALQPFSSRLVVATTRSHGPVAWLARLWGMEVVYTEGRGYELDFSELLPYAPAVVAACDLPFLTPNHVARLISKPLMSTAVGAGGYVGLTWLPSGDTARWVDVSMPDLVDVDTREGWMALAGCTGPIYPVFVDPGSLLPHEDVESVPALGGTVRPIAVDAWTCTVLDGHHRLSALAERGLPAPVVPLDYSRIDVRDGDGNEVSKLAVLAAASRGVRLGVRATRHYYNGVHVSELDHVEADIGFLARARPLRCDPI
ncbi:MAG: NTP transferase domain-containing protein [Thermoproteus sp.]